MSESKRMGRCRSELTAAYRARGWQPNDFDEVIADAIDRLAADVAVIEAKVNDIMPEDRRRVVESNKAWRKLVEQQRDAAILKRDEALALLNSVLAQCTTAHSALRKTCESRDALLFQRNEARAEVERLKAIVHSDAGHMARILNEVERLRAELAARPAANSPGLSDSSPTAPQPAAPPPGWLTDRERHVLSSLLSERPCDWSLHWADDIQPAFRSILSRAGSPPVVEVPALEFLGAMTGREQGIAVAYRAALDRAGVAWR